MDSTEARGEARAPKTTRGKRKRAIYLGAPDGVPSSLDDNDLLGKLQASGGNSGNLLIGYALKRHLDADFHACNSAEAARSLRRFCDFVAIAAANFVSPHFDMSELAEIVEAADLPCVIVGLGAQAPRQGQEVAIPDGTLRFLRAVAERAHSIGVRGANTAQILFDYDIRNVEVVGCPSLYLAAEGFRSAADADLCAFAINGSCDVVPHSVDPDRMTRWEGQLYRQAMECGAEYVLQSDRLQIEVKSGEAAPARLAAMRARFPDLWDVPDEQFLDFIANRCRIFFDVPTWVDYLGGKAVSIGSRFHGNVAALMAGVPVLFICHDARTIEMCQFARVPHLTVAEVEDCGLAALARSIDMGPFQRRLPKLRANFLRFLERNEAPVAHAAGDSGS